MSNIVISSGIPWRWCGFLLLFPVYVVFVGKFTAIAEMLLYSMVFGAVFLYLFYHNPYHCLYFFIVWLPLQTFALSLMAASEIFSDQLITFLSSLKELALAMLFVTLLKKRLILRGRLSGIDYLFLLNVILILVYAVLPDSFFGVPGGLKVKLFGLRSSLVTLVIFLAGRCVPYDVTRIRHAVRLLGAVCVLIVLFGCVEFFFIPRETLIAGLIPYNVLKGANLENMQRVDWGYVVDYGGFHFKRMMSFFLSPLGLAYFLIFPFCLALSTMRLGGFAARKTMQHSAVLLVVFSVAIMLSITRAVIAACLLMVALVYAGRHFYKGLVILALICLIFIISPMSMVINQTINLEDPSARAHLFAYAIGFKTILERPLGIGLGQAGPTAVFIKGAEGLYGKDDATIGESLYLTMAMERGLPSLLIFIVFVCSIAWAGKRLGQLPAASPGNILGSAVFLSTLAFMIASIPTEHWLGFQSAGIYWWFAGTTVQLFSMNTSYKGREI